MTFLAKQRERKMSPRVKRLESFYNIDQSNEYTISKYQLEQFNKLWKEIQENVPFYKELVKKGEAPKHIDNWNDFKILPVKTRYSLSTEVDRFRDYRRDPDGWQATGGSTGTPLSFPTWKSESENIEPTLWYARRFYGIKRSDRMFRLWGHSHTLGSGLGKYKQLLKFKIGLPLIGYKRFSAYDLSEKNLREAGDQILNFKPDYIIGYSKALNMLARMNQDRMDRFRSLKLKAVIGAAEGFDDEKDKELVKEVFGCPVALEYASMESKILAHTHPDGGYKVFWGNHIVETVKDETHGENEGKILVTSLYPKAFPLIRYELGDTITFPQKDDSSESVHSFQEVQGKNNDFLMLDSETRIHSISVHHAVKTSNKVTAFQVRYNSRKEYTLYIQCMHDISSSEFALIRSRLKQIDYRLGDIPIKCVSQLKQTVAGKTKWLMKE